MPRNKSLKIIELRCCGQVIMTLCRFVYRLWYINVYKNPPPSGDLRRNNNANVGI